MTEKTKATGMKLEPECEIRRGEISATIFVRQAPTGYLYRTYSLSRCWQSVANGRPQQGSSFFDGNEDDLVATIKAASDHIRAKNNGLADQDTEEPAIDPTAD